MDGAMMTKAHLATIAKLRAWNRCSTAPNGRYRSRPIMPGRESWGQRIIRTTALTTVSYGTLHTLWPRIDWKAVHRVINQARFESFGYPVTVK
jgi:hypothetical protein